MREYLYQPRTAQRVPSLAKVTMSGAALKDQKHCGSLGVEATRHFLRIATARTSQEHTCPVFSALMRKYVDTSIGEMTPFGIYTKDPSENTAEFKAAK